jgi:DNA repair protein RadC
MVKYPTPALHLLPLCERPVCRIAEAGADACNVVELLATIVGGSRQIEIAWALLERFGDVSGIGRASVPELVQVQNMGPARAARLKAAFELSRRLSLPGDERPQVRTPVDAVELLMPGMRLLEQEEMWVMSLDTRNRVLDVDKVYRGNLNGTRVRPCEVFRSAIRAGVAAAVIVAHNHPSGDCTPSPVIWRIRKSQVGTRLETDAQDNTGWQRRRTLQAACGGRGEGAFFCEKTPPSPHTPFPQRNLVSPPFAERLSAGVVVHGCGYGIHTYQSVAIEVISSEKHLWSSEWMHWSPAASRASGSAESRSWMWESMTLALIFMPSWRNRSRISCSRGRSPGRAQKRSQRRHLTSLSQWSL